MQPGSGARPRKRPSQQAAAGLIDAADYLMRVYMRVRGWFVHPAIGETFFGARLHCDTRDYIQRRIYHFGVFEPNLTNYILENLSEGDQFLDVGANCGYISLLASKVVGASGKVIAIEASPTTYALLLKNLSLNGFAQNVVPLNVAAAAGPCEVVIVVRDERNIGANAIQPATGADAVTVRGDALSNMAEIDRAGVGFIKIDIEGSERPVLTDILEHLGDYRKLKTIVVELSASSADLLPRFVAAGFRAYVLPNNYRIGYLFVRSYLSRSGEDGYVVKRPVDAYDPAHVDYVFERG